MKIKNEKEIDFNCKHEINEKKINFLNKVLEVDENIKMQIIEDEDNILVLFLNGDKGSRITYQAYNEYANRNEEIDADFGNQFSFLYVTNHCCYIDNEQGTDPKDIYKIIVEV